MIDFQMYTNLLQKINYIIVIIMNCFNFLDQSIKFEMQYKHSHQIKYIVPTKKKILALIKMYSL